MKSVVPQKIYYLFGYIVFISLLWVSTTISRQSSLSTTFKSLFSQSNLSTRYEVLFTTSKCSDISSQRDQCGFVQSHCNGYNAMYLELYYCSTDFWKPVSIAILLSCLLMLFGAISVVASDFFCPNLQTISSKLQLSESMAGVTVLALGNGSPDLFSTFSALDTGAGSLAIGELIGAAFFIVAIVSGCMGIIKPFQSQKVTFMRDASFLTGAIMIIAWIVYHQRIHWYHSIALICYYLCYVSAVVLSAYNNNNNRGSLYGVVQQKSEHNMSKDHVDETTHLLYQGGKIPSRLVIPNNGFSMQSNMSDFNGQNHLGHIIRPMSPNLSSRPSLNFDSTIPQSTSTNGSIMSSRIYCRPMTPRVGMRTSIFGAIEFQEQVDSIRRANSSLSVLSNQRRHRQISMPPPLWQNFQGQTIQPHHQQQKQQQHLHAQSNDSVGRLSVSTGGRQRASTMTEQSLLLSAPLITSSSSMALVPAMQVESSNLAASSRDYFTYLSVPNHLSANPLHQYHHDSIKIQVSSSIPIPQSNATEIITIPEIRLAPPQNNKDDKISLPPVHTMEVHQLAPRSSPSLLSVENDDVSFYSAHQSTFEISPSNSYVDHRAYHTEHDQYNTTVTISPSIITDITHLNISSFHHHEGVTSLLCSATNKSFHFHSRENSEYYSFYSKHFYPSMNNLTVQHATMKSSKWYFILDDISQVVLPTLQGWRTKSLFSKLNALAAAPLVLIFTLTLPVAEIEQIKVDDVEVLENEEDEIIARAATTELLDNHTTVATMNYLAVPPVTAISENDLTSIVSGGVKIIVDDVDTSQGWNKYLLMSQSVISPVFIFSILAVNKVIPFTMITLGAILGLIAAAFVMKKTKADEPPSWFWTLSFFGFAVALNWIFLLANEVVGLLQALGQILSISDAIMGLTVFALGNSVGDLVANIAIAKMGFPTMAISACYAGPLLNMVLGVGVSSFYQSWKTGHAYELDIAPAIVVSCIGLMTVLLSTLIVVNLNGYHVTAKLGWWMIVVYLICCTISFLLEFQIII